MKGRLEKAEITDRDKRCLDEKGVALLLILWVLFLLSVISAEFAFSMRTDFAITLAFKEEMEAYYLAQAGINQAIAKILHEKMVYDQSKKFDPEALEELKASAPSEELTNNLESGTFYYELIDEEGKININSLKRNNSHDRNILRCLLDKAVGIEDESMQDTIIDSIMDWMDPDDLFKPAGAEEDYYQELDPPYHCKNGPFDTVEELLLVQGMTKEILFGGQTSDGDKNYPGIGRYLTVWTSAFKKKVATVMPLSCKLGEDAAEQEMLRRQEELEDPSLQNRDVPPSRHWTIKAVGQPTGDGSARTIVAAIKMVFIKKVTTVKVLYWDDNYIDQFVQYQEPEYLSIDRD